MEIIRAVVYFYVCLYRYFVPREEIQILHPTVQPFESKKDYSTDPKAIKDWYRHMLDRHASQAELLEWRVTEIRWYKNLNRLEHEFVVFVVQASNSTKTLFLRFDQRPTAATLRKEKMAALVKEEDYKNLSEQDRAIMLKAVKDEADILSKPNSIFNYAVALRSPFGAVELKAVDTMTSCRQPDGTVKGPPEKAELLVTYSNFRKDFTLQDLAIIAREITAYSDGDLLLVQQCYWFARTLVNVSIAMYKPQPMDGGKEPPFSRAGKFSRLPLLEPVNADNHTEVNMLITEYIKPTIEKDNERLRAIEFGRGAKDRVIEEQKRALAKSNAERDEAMITIANRDAKAKAKREEAMVTIAKLEEELRRVRRANGSSVSKDM